MLLLLLSSFPLISVIPPLSVIPAAFVIPTKVGIQTPNAAGIYRKRLKPNGLDSRLRGNDGGGGVPDSRLRGNDGGGGVPDSRLRGNDEKRSGWRAKCRRAPFQTASGFQSAKPARRVRHIFADTGF
ncbi:TPA: hypothetical protein ACFOL6_000159 [Neisseria meningitidis]|uniref:hypothetical protein n=1 Tax=Neisseria meningitidis TaxID=487 RepID=UPI000BB60062|nr:hypothetical protein [Neisseria meningitidis]